jgi:glycosyltransferase involved in cell wall biosynthesis
MAVDQGQADIVQTEFGVDSHRLSVIPNAVDVEGFSPQSGGGVVPPFVVVPRRLVPKNGVEFAIRAWSFLDHPRPQLVVAGGGPELEALRRLAFELHLERDVTFRGDVPRTELLSLMSLSVAVIVPSVPANGVVEATSLAALEALAAGVPLIASDIGGLSDILRRAGGLPVPPAAPEAIAAAVALVSRMSSGERAEHVFVARERVRQAFGLEVWLDRHQALYMASCGGIP